MASKRGRTIVSMGQAFQPFGVGGESAVPSPPVDLAAKQYISKLEGREITIFDKGEE